MKRAPSLVAAGFLIGFGSFSSMACKKDVGSDTRSSAAVAQGQSNDERKDDGIAEINVDDLDRQLAAGGAQAVDANGNITRKRMGTIPGAVLLSDYEAFSLSELPADKARPLVFYCANEYCGASHEAAKRARFAGHSDVKVLPAGIAGWVKAGKTATKI
jgi:rhodanese-related sulfurtransferase